MSSATAVMAVRVGKLASRWMPATTGTTATAEKPWQRQKSSAIPHWGILDHQGVKIINIEGGKKIISKHIKYFNNKKFAKNEHLMDTKPRIFTINT